MPRKVKIIRVAGVTKKYLGENQTVFQALMFMRSNFFRKNACILKIIKIPLHLLFRRLPFA